MNKRNIIPTAISWLKPGAIKRIAIMAIPIIALSSCTAAGESPETGFPAEGKTPLSIGQITVTSLRGETRSRHCEERSNPGGEAPLPGSLDCFGTPRNDGETRSTGASPAPAFFSPDDALRILRGTETISTAKWNGTEFSAPNPALYLEDFFDAAAGEAPEPGTSTLLAEFGNTDITPDQSTAAHLHAADYIRGALTLDVPTKSLTSATMTHQHTQLILAITPGDGWDNDDDYTDFLTHFATGTDGKPTYYIHTTTGGGEGDNVYPQATLNSQLSTLNLIAILPPASVPSNPGDALLTLTVPGSDGGTRILRLTGEEGITPQAGQSITITATYHKKGTFTGITTTLAQWEDVTEGKELTAHIAEKQRFLNWAKYGWETRGFTLQCDIDLGDEDFEPIAFGYYVYFNHTFDGGGHTISGLKINKPEDGTIGLFGGIGSTGSVRNLTVAGNITGYDNTGGIAGSNWGTISGCTFRGTVTGNGSDTGGIAGYNWGLIAGCRVTKSIITGSDLAGGIAGWNASSATGIIACLADDVTLKGTYEEGVELGGIAGGNGGTLVACVAAPKEMTSQGIETYAGGITGFNWSTITTCYYQTGTGYDTAIGLEWNEPSQEGNCISFAPGAFGTHTDAIEKLNAAIEEWNEENPTRLCNFRWQAGEGIPSIAPYHPLPEGRGN